MPIHLAICQLGATGELGMNLSYSVEVDFVNKLIGRNIRYSIVLHISAHMNEAINEIEQYNKNKKKSKNIAGKVVNILTE